jgi:S-DNA-T family DNA segregation ATPase FtsK/SpoIIIE
MVAGMTGSGKSYLMSQIAIQLLSQYGPAQMQLAVVDLTVPEHSVWSHYRSLPHLLAPLAQKHSDAVKLVEHIATEMGRRYTLLESAEANSIDEYNGRHNPLPHLLLVIDELSGITDSEGAGASKTFREQIAAIARKGRAAGVMLLIGVQRPSEETLSDDLLGNMTNRIALRLLTAGESEMVLGEEAGDAATYLEPMGDGIYTLDGERTRFSPLFMPIKPADRRGEGETYPLLEEHLDKIATRWRP